MDSHQQESEQKNGKRTSLSSWVKFFRTLLFMFSSIANLVVAIEFPVIIKPFTDMIQMISEYKLPALTEFVLNYHILLFFLGFAWPLLWIVALYSTNQNQHRGQRNNGQWCATLIFGVASGGMLSQFGLTLLALLLAGLNFTSIGILNGPSN